jgi:hypothetical protein
MEEDKKVKKPKTILEYTVTVILLIIILTAAFVLLFNKIEENKEHPLIMFNEDPDEEGTYIGVVQDDTDHNISDISITVIDDSSGESGSMDPIVPEFTLIIYHSYPSDMLNFTFYDKNNNNIFDSGDELVFKNVEKGDLILMVHKTGKSIFHYTF